MANEKNLEKGKATQFKSGENAATNGRKGGKKSGENKRRRKQIQDDLRAALSTVIEYEGEILTAQEALIKSVLVNGILKGDLRALEVITELLGEDAKSKLQKARFLEEKKTNGKKYW